MHITAKPHSKPHAALLPHIVFPTFAVALFRLLFFKSCCFLPCFSQLDFIALPAGDR